MMYCNRHACTVHISIASLVSRKVCDKLDSSALIEAEQTDLNPNEISQNCNLKALIKIHNYLLSTKRLDKKNH